MINDRLLRGKIIEKGLSIESISKKCGFSKSTFYRKIASKGEGFTIGEASKIACLLGLNKTEASDIFFASIVA